MRQLLRVINHNIWIPDKWLLNCFPGEKWLKLLTEDKQSICCRTDHSKTVAQDIDNIYFAHRFAICGAWWTHFVSSRRLKSTILCRGIACVGSGCWLGLVWGYGWSTYMWPFHGVDLSPQGECPTAEPGRSCISCYVLTLEVLQHHCLHILVWGGGWGCGGSQSITPIHGEEN